MTKILRFQCSQFPLASRSWACLQLTVSRSPLWPSTVLWDKMLFPRAWLFLAACLGNRKSSSQRCLQNTLEIVRRQWKLTLGMVNLLWSSQQLSCGTYQLTCSCSFPSGTWVYESSAFFGRETLKEIKKKKNFFCFSLFCCLFGSYDKKTRKPDKKVSGDVK